MTTDAAGVAPLERPVGRPRPKRDRMAWLQDWIHKHGKADVLNSDLVWEYVEATQAMHNLQMFGAPRCRQLGVDLAALYRQGAADRRAVGIGDGLSSQGFPRWVWSYRLRHEKPNAKLT